MQSSPDGTLTFVNNTGPTRSPRSITTWRGGESDDSARRIDAELCHLHRATSVGFAAVPNYSNGNLPALPGAIVRFNPTDGSLNTAIPFPNVRYLAMDTAEKHLLAFTDVG